MSFGPVALRQLVRAKVAIQGMPVGQINPGWHAVVAQARNHAGAAGVKDAALGRLAVLGKGPVSLTRVSTAPVRVGTDDSKAAVQGWCGPAKTASTGPISGTWPRYITAIGSDK